MDRWKEATQPLTPTITFTAKDSVTPGVHPHQRLLLHTQPHPSIITIELKAWVGAVASTLLSSGISAAGQYYHCFDDGKGRPVAKPVLSSERKC